MNTPPSKRTIGQSFEDKAKAFLEGQGLTCVARNFLCKVGELDLIMLDQAMLVFVEVRFRSSKNFGGSEASVSYGKQQRLIRAAAFYLKKTYGTRPPMCRFDVVAINGDNVNWIKNAFYAF